MANTNTTNTANHNNGARPATAGCTTPANTFAAMADSMTESCRAAFDMNKRFVETWTKNWTAMPFSPEQAMTRWTSFVTGVTNQATRTMTEVTNLAVEQTKVNATMIERGMKALGATVATAPKTIPTDTRDIMTEAFDATARNTERLTRLGLTNLETMTGLVESATCTETTCR